MGAILIDKVMVLEWFVHYRICFFFKSDSYALTVECLYEWFFAGRGREMRHGIVTLEMPANSCSMFLLGFRWLPLVFLKKTQHFGCQGFLKRGRTESIENCWRLEVAVMPEHLEICPCICPSIQGDLLERDNSSCFPNKLGLLARSPSLSFSPLHRQRLVSQPVFSLQTRTATVQSLNQHEILDSQLCSDCRNVTF